MITIDSIKTELYNQNLEGLGFYSTTQSSDWFNKLSTSIGIDAQLIDALVTSAVGAVPVFYWKYDSIENSLKLVMKRFSYQNETWTHLNFTQKDLNINWILSPEKEYIITYPSNCKVGQAFNRHIPIVYRNH